MQLPWGDIKMCCAVIALILAKIWFIKEKYDWIKQKMMFIKKNRGSELSGCSESE
jgi:hypothetical protein